MKTPDLTPAAITALVLAIVTNAVLLFGLDLTDSQRGAMSGLITAVVLAAFLIHDAIIRQGRAKISAAKASVPPPAPVERILPPRGVATTFVATASPTPAAPKPRTRTRTRKTPPKT